MLILYNLDNSLIEITEKFPSNFTGIIEWPDGSKEWCAEDKMHRLDSPALIDAHGGKYWYINDEEVTELHCKLLHDIMKLKGLL
jgi:hypothetical protein